MQDYPEDAGPRMTQVFNGGKMLFDGPSDIGTPTVRVHGLVFFVNEILQLASGGYFIPVKYFYAVAPGCEGSSGSGSEKELFALGHDVERLEVSRVYLSRASMLTESARRAS